MLPEKSHMNATKNELVQFGLTGLINLTYLMSLRVKPLLLLFLQPKRGREVAGPRRRLLLRVTPNTWVRIHRATELPLVIPSLTSHSDQKCCWPRKDFSGGEGEDGRGRRRFEDRYGPRSRRPHRRRRSRRRSSPSIVQRRLRSLH